MKSFLLQSLFIFLIMGTAFGQVVETFEDETEGATSFTIGEVNFTTTGDLIIEVTSGFGCGPSDSYLGTGTGNGGSSGSFGSIKVTNPGDKFMIVPSELWCAFVSFNDGVFSASGDVKFTGTLLSGGTIEETLNVVPSSSNGYGEIAFSSGIWEDQWLTELEASIASDINYLALDNIVLELTVSISNIQEEEIKIYPNPAEGEIEIIGIDNFDVKIIDAFGRIIKEQFLFHQKIDVSGLPKGIYFISIYTDNQQFTKRIIKH